VSNECDREASQGEILSHNRVEAPEKKIILMILTQHKPHPAMIKFKPRGQIHTYYAEGAFELQNFHNHDLSVDCLVELGSKARLKKLSKLSLSLKRVP
jgi:hypothetical protein